MPTGYTAEIANGIDFNTFLLRCARAFGACIEMRDLPHDLPPQLNTPSSYHKDSLKEAKKTLAALKKMTLEEARQKADMEYLAEQEHYTTKLHEAQELRAKYEDMLDQVEKWVPPTPDHINLKNFMRDQIQESIGYDCETRYLKKPLLHSASDWKELQLQRARADVKYHTEHWAEEQQQVEQRNAWIMALYGSLTNAK